MAAIAAATGSAAHAAPRPSVQTLRADVPNAPDGPDLPAAGNAPKVPAADDTPKAASLQDWIDGIGRSSSRADTVAAMAAACGVEDDDDTPAGKDVLASRARIAGQRALVPGLIAALDDADDDVGQQAAALLALVGPRDAGDAVPALAARIGARQGIGDLQYRHHMAVALTALAGGPDRAVRILAWTLLRGRDASERARAAVVLGSWISFEPDDGAVTAAFAGAAPALAASVTSDRDPAVRTAASTAIRKLARIPSPAAWGTAAAILSAAAESTSRPPEERVAMMVLLRKISANSGDVTASLRRIVSDPEESVSVAAAVTLAYMKDPSLSRPNSPTALRVARLESKDEATRRQALDELAPLLGVGGPSPSAANPPWAAALLPGLIQAIRTETDWSQQQALGILARIGPDALPAAPALVALAAGDSSPDHALARSVVTGALAGVAGGPDAVGPYLQKRLAAPDENARRDAAICLGLLDENDSGAQTRQIRTGVWNAIPALTWAAVDDKPAVRLAALASLDSLSDGSPAAPWRSAIPLLAPRMADASLPMDERRAAARLLARIPADPLAALPQVRQTIVSDDPVLSGYALFILDHCVQIAPARVVAAIPGDLTSHYAALRLDAARQMAAAAGVFWRCAPGEISPDENLAIDPHLAWPNGLQVEGVRVPAAYDDTCRERVVIALGDALADTDPAVRTAAARALEQIGRLSRPGGFSPLTIGGKPFRPARGYSEARVYAAIKPPIIVAPGEKTGPYGLIPVLLRAQKAVQAGDPALAKRLGALASDIVTPRPAL
jgi:hypothetical protein